ncbi:unnamed protein product [Microthlaspi erraticum]|uniref:Uncharacterized protein n=1 Tax=Microthlaspi erraticum TaxID=1685480 RepID=A0A6D2HR63_9BRAS|nr:unnamed protein product [Microthlaspi erraticum]
MEYWMELAVHYLVAMPICGGRPLWAGGHFGLRATSLGSSTPSISRDRVVIVFRCGLWTLSWVRVLYASICGVQPSVSACGLWHGG